MATVDHHDWNMHDDHEHKQAEQMSQLLMVGADTGAKSLLWIVELFGERAL